MESPDMLTNKSLKPGKCFPLAYDLLHYDDVGFGVIFDTATCILSAIIGAFIGGYLGTLWKKRQQL